MNEKEMKNTLLIPEGKFWDLVNLDLLFPVSSLLCQKVKDTK